VFAVNVRQKSWNPMGRLSIPEFSLDNFAPNHQPYGKMNSCLHHLDGGNDIARLFRSACLIPEPILAAAVVTGPHSDL
jgi:hypothetical protein